MYTIYRNGKELAQVESNRYIDRDFSRDETLTYAIHCERSIAQSEETFNNARSFIAKAIGLLYSKTTEKKASVEGFTMMKSIDVPSALLVPVFDYQKPSVVDVWEFRYKTFIEDNMIENPNVISPNRYFLGDNRTFDLESDAYRSYVDIELSYKNPDDALTFTKRSERVWHMD